MDRRRQTSSGVPSHQAVLISLHRFSLHRTCGPFQLNSGPLRGSTGVRSAPKPAELPDFRGVLISRPVRRRCKGLPGHTPQTGAETHVIALPPARRASPVQCFALNLSLVRPQRKVPFIGASAVQGRRRQGCSRLTRRRRRAAVQSPEATNPCAGPPRQYPNPTRRPAPPERGVKEQTHETGTSIFPPPR